MIAHLLALSMLGIYCIVSDIIVTFVKLGLQEITKVAIRKKKNNLKVTIGVSFLVLFSEKLSKSF